ncbi:hypothetical protein [Caulobacter sp. Root1455]|jgi:hypothetical protein|nr:hypothetical protein [Caulobacter sp. Root1455]
MARKQTSQPVSSLAAKVLAGKPASRSEQMRLAGSVLSQDEKRGK